jgi:sec-independent protein translocase protein TatC
MYPLVLVFLELVGAVPSTTWRRWRRPAIVIICLVAAVITPSSDPFSFLAMSIPMLLLYEVAILVGRLLKK